MNLESDGVNAAIVAAVSSFAHNLNLKVTAEGVVETEEQLNFLQIGGVITSKVFSYVSLLE